MRAFYPIPGKREPFVSSFASLLGDLQNQIRFHRAWYRPKRIFDRGRGGHPPEEPSGIDNELQKTRTNLR
jgi:hypothetical protein